MYYCIKENKFKLQWSLLDLQTNKWYYFGPGTLKKLYLRKYFTTRFTKRDICLSENCIYNALVPASQITSDKIIFIACRWENIVCILVFNTNSTDFHYKNVYFFSWICCFIRSAIKVWCLKNKVPLQKSAVK